VSEVNVGPGIGDLGGASVLVTGGASGIGRGLAAAVASAGAGVVTLLDVEEPALASTLEALGAEFPDTVVRAEPVDVTDADAVDAAVERTWGATGGIDLAFLNAGVFAGGRVWQATEDDWTWVQSVNVGGVVHGVRAVVPRMIDRGAPATVVVTASVAGVVAAPVSAPYVVSKFAAVGLAEALHHDLQLAGVTHVRAAVLCPAMVATNIGDAERNRPASLGDAGDDDGVALARAGIDEAMRTGVDPRAGAEEALRQLAAGRFYISTHPVELWERLVAAENEDRLAGRAPRFQMYE
jgi:NAD(P)-dependent dehydrogenase (short-subunit alcohol dehydrogenase family)